MTPPPVETIRVPPGTIPPDSPDPYGWSHSSWKPYGFRPAGPPPWPVPAGCAVEVRSGDLLGPEHKPFRLFRTIRYEAAPDPGVPEGDR